jgi:hypothetical protein
LNIPASEKIEDVRPDDVRVGEFFQGGAEQRGQVGVFFHGMKTARIPGDPGAEVTDAGTDLQHAIAGSGLDGVGNAAQRVRVDQKILPQPFFCPE